MGYMGMWHWRCPMHYNVSLTTLTKWMEAAYRKGNMDRYNLLMAAYVERTQ